MIHTFYKTRKKIICQQENRIKLNVYNMLRYSTTIYDFLEQQHPPEQDLHFEFNFPVSREDLQLFTHLGSEQEH